jgi:AcrR family transcriptional regulator
MAKAEAEAPARTGRNNVLSDIRRQQLSDAAYKVVSRKGYSNFTIMDVAAEAGLSAGLVHYYFKDKQDLLLHLFKETQKNVRRRLLAELVRAEEPLGKLEIFIEESFLLFEREKDYFSLLFEFWTEIHRNEDIGRMVRKLYRAYREEISIILRDGIEKGVFRPLDVPYAATLFVSMVQHTFIQHLIDEEAFDFAEYSGRIKAFIIQMAVGNPPADK